MRFKNLLPPTAAKDSLDGDLFFVISLREITKNKSPSKCYLARSAEKILFTQPHSFNKSIKQNGEITILSIKIHTTGIPRIGSFKSF